MTIVIIFVAIMFLAMQTLSLRKISVSGLRENLFSTGIFTAIIAVCFWIYTLISKETISLPTVIWGFVFGAAFVTTIIVYYYAMQTGPLSYTTFLFSASMVIPAIAGIVFWKEAVKLTTIIGMLLFLAAFYFISVAGKGSGGKINKKWLVFCFLSWLVNGCCSVISKIQQTVMQSREVVSMMTISFTFAFFLCLIAYAIICFTSKQKVSIKADMSIIKRSLMPIILVALGSGAGNAAVFYLSPRLPSAYLFPFVLGGLVIVVTLYSRIFLKEVISRFGIIGISIGLLAIITINL